MLAAILSLLSSIGGFFSNIFGKFFDYKTAVITAEGAATVESIKDTASVENKWWFVGLLIPILTLPVAIYIWKVMAWDKVFGPALGMPSSTDPLGGPLGIYMNIVITGLFLHSWIKS